jgi:peptide/nickel transport system substrate-binding protein
MSDPFRRGGAPHPAVPALAAAARAGLIGRRTFLAQATALGLAGAAARAMLGLAPARAETAAPRRGGVLRVSMFVKALGDPRLFAWSEAANVARQLCEPLVRWDPAAGFEPWLLADWSVSDDARDYRLDVRRGVTWSNGDPFGADDVIRMIGRWADATVEGNSMATRLAALVDPATRMLRAGAVARVDDFTVRLSLSRPDATRIAGLADYPALVTHASLDAAGGELAAAPVGTGPFALEALEPGVRARVARAARPWWGGETFLDAVEWRDLGAAPARERAAFAAGEIDLNFETAADFVASYDALGLSRREAVTANTLVARMRMTAPPFDDPRVRRAVQAAVDNAVVLEVGYGGAGIVAQNDHVGPMHPDRAEIAAPRPDPAAALAALREAGVADREFELVSIDDDWRRNTTDAIAAQLLDAGFKVRRTLAPAADYWRAWRDYPFSTTNWNGRPLGVQTLALAYRSGGAWNETGFADPGFDALLDRALATPDPVRRRALMAGLQTLLRDSGAIVQPYWRRIFAHAAPRLRGFAVHPSFEQRFERVWLDDA